MKITNEITAAVDKGSGVITINDVETQVAEGADPIRRHYKIVCDAKHRLLYSQLIAQGWTPPPGLIVEDDPAWFKRTLRSAREAERA